MSLPRLDSQATTRLGEGKLERLLERVPGMARENG
jgi:hypothetical protein